MATDQSTSPKEATVSIRVLEDPDVSTVLEMYKTEGWNTTENLFAALRACDPNGVFVAVNKEGRIVGTIVMSNLDETTAFLDTFLVEETLRGKGIGSQLFSRAIAYAGDRNIGLNAVVYSQELYARKGFKIKAFTVIDYEGTGQENIICTHRPEVTLVNYEAKYHEALLDYDQSVNTLRRQMFLGHFMAPDTQTILAIRNDQITGYACVQPRNEDHDCFRIGPVYADNDETAWVIITELLNKVPQGITVTINILSCNEPCVAFVEAHKFVVVVKAIRMYTTNDIAVAMDKVYAIMSPECGLV